MLDRWTTEWVKPPLSRIAAVCKRLGISANQLTLLGFLIGIATIPALCAQLYWLAFLFVALNRFFDGLDGAVARATKISDAGGFLDISLDFIFYSGVIWGFAMADPEQNGFAAATLIFAFVGSGTSFLAFAVMAAKRDLKNIHFPSKSLYYMGGLTEGTETIIVLLFCCLFPDSFPITAYIYAALCWITTTTRIINGFYTLKNSESDQPSD